MRDLNVINYDDYGKVTFAINDQPLTGQKLLLQKIVYALYNIKGSNGFLPTKGTNFFLLAGRNYSKDQIGEIRVWTKAAIDEIQETILAEQSQESNLASNEKLVSIELTSVEYDKTNQKWDIIIRVITEASSTPLTIGV